MTLFLFPPGAEGARFIIAQKNTWLNMMLSRFFFLNQKDVFGKKNSLLFQTQNPTLTWSSVLLLTLDTPPTC